jgi:hypothetical protein
MVLQAPGHVYIVHLSFMLLVHSVARTLPFYYSFKKPDMRDCLAPFALTIPMAQSLINLSLHSSEDFSGYPI